MFISTVVFTIRSVGNCTICQFGYAIERGTTMTLNCRMHTIKIRRGQIISPTIILGIMQREQFTVVHFRASRAKVFGNFPNIDSVGAKTVCERVVLMDVLKWAIFRKQIGHTLFRKSLVPVAAVVENENFDTLE